MSSDTVIVESSRLTYIIAHYKLTEVLSSTEELDMPEFKDAIEFGQSATLGLRIIFSHKNYSAIGLIFNKRHI